MTQDERGVGIECQINKTQHTARTYELTIYLTLNIYVFQLNAPGHHQLFASTP